MKSLFALAFAAIAAFAMPSQAAPISEGIWQLQNTTNHSLGEAGFYRYNTTAKSYDLYDFETNGADVKLRYDATAGTIAIAGQAYDTVGSRLVDFDLNYTGLSANGDRVGTSFMGATGTFDGVAVSAKPSMETGLSLYLDPYNPVTPQRNLYPLVTGHSWLSTDAGHFGDFHFSGQLVSGLTSSGGGSVPAPGGIAFLMLGAIALRRMRKQNASFSAA